jgi:hypothetical protein
MVHCRTRCLPQRWNVFSSRKVLKCYSKSSCSETRLPNGSFFVLPVWLLGLWGTRGFAGLWWSVWSLFLVKAGLWWRLPGEESSISLSGKGPLRIGNRAESALILWTIRLFVPLVVLLVTFEGADEDGEWSEVMSKSWRISVPLATGKGTMLLKGSNSDE